MENLIEEEFKYSLGMCKNCIKSWQRWHMRKNSKYKSIIQLRCHTIGIDSRFWRYYLELWINGEMKEQILIKPEAYDTFDYDKSLKKQEMKNLEFITLVEFIPTKKQS